MHITKINAVSLGKLLAIIFGVTSFLFAVFWILVLPLILKALIPVLVSKGYAIMVAYSHIETMELMITLLKIPIIWGVFAFILGIIIALIYNLISRYFSRLELEMRDH